MAQKYNNGIATATGLKISSATPADDRTVVINFADLANITYKYDGLITKVTSENKFYQYNEASTAWEEFGADVATPNIQQVLDAGSTAYTNSNIIIQTNNGIATFQNNKGGISAGQTELNVNAAVPIRLSSDQGVIISSLSVPAKYQNNLAANFDDRSIPDCAWVMSQISGSSAPSLQQVINVGDSADHVIFSSETQTIMGETDGNIYSIVDTPDGGSIITGSFAQFNNEERPNIVKLFPNGERDYSFNPIISNSPGNIVRVSDGYFITASVANGGTFSSYNNTFTEGSIVKINFDGSVKQTYPLGDSTTVYAVYQMADGTILLGGNLDRFGATNFGNSDSKLLKILDDGTTLDTSFGSGNGYVSVAPAGFTFDAVIENNGKIYAASYTNINIFDLDGNLLKNFGFNFANINYMTVGDDGRIYFMYNDYNNGNTGIGIIDDEDYSNIIYANNTNTFVGDTPVFQKGDYIYVKVSGQNSDTNVRRYTLDGTLDPDFIISAPEMFSPMPYGGGMFINDEYIYIAISYNYFYKFNLEGETNIQTSLKFIDGVGTYDSAKSYEGKADNELIVKSDIEPISNINLQKVLDNGSTATISSGVQITASGFTFGVVDVGSFTLNPEYTYFGGSNGTINMSTNGTFIDSSGHGFQIFGGAGGQITTNPTTGIRVQGNAGGVSIGGNSSGVTINGEGGNVSIGVESGKNLNLTGGIQHFGNGGASVFNAAGGSYTFSGAGNFSGITYAQNYSANYTDRSLVDRGFIKTGYVPYTGATQGVNIGTNTLSAGTLNLYNGANWNSRFYAASQNGFGFRPGSATTFTLNINNLSANRDYQMPNNSGIIPLTVNGITADSAGNIVVPTGGFSPTGTSAQYVAGDGTYRTFQTDTRATTLSGLSIANAAIASGDTILTALGKAQGQINVKFNTPTGSTAQYVRGDGSLSSFQSTALATTITGLTFTNSAVNNGDSIVGAIGKLQQQHDVLSGMAILIDGASPIDIERAWYGNKTQFDAIPVIDPATEYNLYNMENYGNMTINPSTGDTYTIAHGLGVIPAYVDVTFDNYTSSELREYKISATTNNIILQFANMPSETSLKVWWLVKA